MSHVPLPDLTGLEWSQAREALRQAGFDGEALQVLDVTPPSERLARSQQRPFEWGEPRVVRVRIEKERAQVTLAREMRPSST